MRVLTRSGALFAVALAAGYFVSDAVALATTEQGRPPVVSMIELLANKDKFNGKAVQVSGYLSVRFEDNALYFDENAYLHMFTENALWIDIDQADRAAFERYNGRPGYVIGVFKSENCNGHLCLYGGRIERAKLGLMYKEQ